MKDKSRKGRLIAAISAVPVGTLCVFRAFTRQFLPGYFQSPLPGLDRVARQGIA
jgi:hypothetical protein